MEKHLLYFESISKDLNNNSFKLWHVEYQEDVIIDFTTPTYIDVPMPDVRGGFSKKERLKNYELINLAFTHKPWCESHQKYENPLADLNDEVNEIMNQWKSDHVEEKSSET